MRRGCGCIFMSCRAYNNYSVMEFYCGKADWLSCTCNDWLTGVQVSLMCASVWHLIRLAETRSNHSVNDVVAKQPLMYWVPHNDILNNLYQFGIVLSTAAWQRRHTHTRIHTHTHTLILYTQRDFKTFSVCYSNCMVVELGVWCLHSKELPTFHLMRCMKLNELYSDWKCLEPQMSV